MAKSAPHWTDFLAAQKPAGFGEPRRNRTCNLLIKSFLTSQSGQYTVCSFKQDVEYQIYRTTIYMRPSACIVPQNANPGKIIRPVSSTLAHVGFGVEALAERG